jgi:hypothetical protein
MNINLQVAGPGLPLFCMLKVDSEETIENLISTIREKIKKQAEKLRKNELIKRLENEKLIIRYRNIEKVEEKFGTLPNFFKSNYPKIYDEEFSQLEGKSRKQTTYDKIKQIFFKKNKDKDIELEDKKEVVLRDGFFFASLEKNKPE